MTAETGANLAQLSPNLGGSKEKTHRANGGSVTEPAKETIMTIMAETTDNRTTENWATCPDWCARHGKTHEPDLIIATGAEEVYHERTIMQTPLVIVTQVVAHVHSSTGTSTRDEALLSIKGGDAIILTAEELRAAGSQMLEAGVTLEAAMIPGARIIENGFVDSVTKVVIYHRVCDGVDEGEIVIPLNGVKLNDFALMLAAMQPGEVYEHDYTFGKGFPKEHMIDTFIGAFRVKERLSGRRFIIVPLALEEAN